jgi:hypothetical protein
MMGVTNNMLPSPSVPSCLTNPQKESDCPMFWVTLSSTPQRVEDLEECLELGWMTYYPALSHYYMSSFMSLKEEKTPTT